MKPLIFILSAYFLLLSFNSNAQVVEEPAKSRQQSSSPAIQKGYYSIGNNAAGLSSGRKAPLGINFTVSRTAPEVKKGYYSIGNNRNKLAKQTTIVISDSEISSDGTRSKKAVPVIKKGYYSIGSNAEKL